MTYPKEHIDAAAPHSGHELTANKDAVSGYVGLDVNKIINSGLVADTYTEQVIASLIASWGLMRVSALPDSLFDIVIEDGNYVILLLGNDDVGTTQGTSYTVPSGKTLNVLYAFSNLESGNSQESFKLRNVTDSTDVSNANPKPTETPTLFPSMAVLSSVTVVENKEVRAEVSETTDANPMKYCCYFCKLV